MKKEATKFTGKKVNDEITFDIDKVFKKDDFNFGVWATIRLTNSSSLKKWVQSNPPTCLKLQQGWMQF